MNSTVCNDADFGLIAHGCRKFDFTIAFQAYIFSIIPSALFLIAPLRLLFLSRLRAKVEGRTFRYLKLVSTNLEISHDKFEFDIVDDHIGWTHRHCPFSLH